MIHPITGPLLLILVASLLVASCQTVSKTAKPTTEQGYTTATTTAPVASPTKPALPATPQVFYLNPEQSRVTIHVYRGGTLARLGHNHVVSAGAVKGLVYYHPDITRAGFDIAISATELEVDNADLRAQAGDAFASEVKPGDIAGTRNNMLGSKVLNAADNPFIYIRSLKLSGKPPQIAATLAITLGGVTRTKTTELELKRTPGQLVASGQLSIRQSDFDIVPLSILGGAIKVRDAVDIHYRLAVDVAD